MRRFYLTLIIYLAGFIALPTALAHRQPIVETTIERMEDGKLGITHRMHAHDAIAILALDSEIKHPELESALSRAKVALYAEEKFLLAQSEESGQLTLIPQTILGAEVEADYLFIYMETSHDFSLDNTYIRSRLLSDISKDWQSYVNIELDDEVHSLSFRKSGSWERVNH